MGTSIGLAGIAYAEKARRDSKRTTATLDEIHERLETLGVADVETIAARVSAHDRYASPEQVIATFAVLPERERAVLAMRMIDGKTFGEIGAAFRVSASRIEQVYDNALRKLRVLQQPISQAS